MPEHRSTSNLQPVTGHPPPAPVRRSATIVPRTIAILCAAAGCTSLFIAAADLLEERDHEVARRGAAARTLHEAGHSLIRDPVNEVEPFQARTRAMASDPRLLPALRSADGAAGEALCNAFITGNANLDAVAIFDTGGQLLCTNSVHADGRPIAADRLQTLALQPIGERDIITRCLIPNTNTEILEFQANCDITPTLFGSSGLSVACSVPVRDDATDQILGVVTARLNFDRVTRLIDGLSIASGQRDRRTLSATAVKYSMRRSRSDCALLRSKGTS